MESGEECREQCTSKQWCECAECCCLSQIYSITAGPARQCGGCVHRECGKGPMGMACMHGMECDGETMPSIEYTHTQ